MPDINVCAAEFGRDGTPMYSPRPDPAPARHYLFKRSLVGNSTARVVGSIDQAYLEQIVREFNRTINPAGRANQGATSESELNFDEPIDLVGVGPELPLPGLLPAEERDKAGRRVEEEEEFLADVTVVYSEQESRQPAAAPAPNPSLTILLSCFVAAIYHITSLEYL